MLENDPNRSSSFQASVDIPVIANISHVAQLSHANAASVIPSILSDSNLIDARRPGKAAYLLALY